MKSKLLIILSIIVLFMVGYFLLNEFKKKQLVNEAQEKAEEYVIENFEDVESVQITTDNYHFDPMCGLSVCCCINEEDKLYFYATFLIEKNKVGELRTIVKAHDFPDSQDEEKEDEKIYLLLILLGWLLVKNFCWKK